MAGLNKVMLIGNVGRDAELRYTASGTPQAQFSLAVNSWSRDDKDRTEWFNVVLWGDTAEKLSQYITKGKPLYVEGRLQTRNWTDDQGQKHYRTEVIGNQIQLLGGGRDEGSGGSGWGDGSQSYSGWGKKDAGDVDDLPFE